MKNIRSKVEINNPTLKKWQEIWGNPRYKALIKLGIYILLIIFVFIIFDMTGKNDKEKATVPSSNTFKEYSNYAYVYQFTYVNEADEPIKNFQVQGKRYIDSSLFTIDETGNTYFERKGSYFLATTKEPISNVIFFDFSTIIPSKLALYIEKMTFEYQTTYADGTLKKGYVIDIPKFASLYAGDSINKQGSVFCTTYEKDKKMNRVTLDMRAYNGILVDIYYQNIHKIDDFREDYS